MEEGDAVGEFLPDRGHGLVLDVLWRDVVGAGIDSDFVEALADFAGNGVDFTDPLDFVAEKLDPVGDVVFVGGDDF